MHIHSTRCMQVLLQSKKQHKPLLCTDVQLLPVEEWIGCVQWVSVAGVTLSFPLPVTPHHTAVKKDTFGWDGKYVWNRTRPRVLVQNQQRRELISAQNT